MRSYRWILQTCRRMCLVLVHSTAIIPLMTLSLLSAPQPVLALAPEVASRASPVAWQGQTQQVARRFAAAPQDISDPYADTASYSGIACSGTSDNAVGAPDGAVATLTGIGCSLTVSFDPTQARTGNLLLYVQNPLSLGLINTLDIMSGTQVLQTVPNAIDLSLIGAQTSTIIYTGSVPYTGVRFNSVLGVNYGVDAVQELPDPPLPPDAYADAAQVSGLTCPMLLGNTAGAATGAPDGILATLGIGLDCTLLLDLGKQEEGLGNLTIYYSGTAHVNAAVTRQFAGW